MASTAEKIKERRLERMRQGQGVADVVPLPSDPEIRLHMVPLTEREYLQALEVVAAIKVADDMAGFAVRERAQASEILIRSIREQDDYTQRVYSTVEDMMDSLEVADVDELIDRYNEMTEASSPRLDEIPPEEFERLKKALQTMDWNALSGPAWYAAKRFLSRISPTPLLDNSLGSISTTKSTTPSE